MMGQLERVWKQARLSLGTKLRIYQACVVSILLYGSECWTLLKKDSDLLQAFHMRSQRRILNIRWFDHVTNAAVTARTGLDSILLTIERRRLSLFGHVRRMDPLAPAHKALDCVVSIQSAGPPPLWRRPRGRPRVSWLKQCSNDMSLSPLEAWTLAADRVQWRALRPFDGQAY